MDLTMMAQAAGTVSSIFAPVSTPAAREAELARMVLWLSAVVFVVVGGLIAYSVVRFRTPAAEQGSEPPQDGTSPFPPAWACFQLGMLWGEFVPIAEPNRAALWYRRAIAYLPGYVKARVHLAEIYASQGQTGEAAELLLPALSSADPEVRWRLADVLAAQDRFAEAETHLEAARSGFEDLLRRHLLDFADHAAEFYVGSGNDHPRALELARANVANRPTRRAVNLAQAIWRRR
jgi:tetratricopeptide (TPR) repeat protein